MVMRSIYNIILAKVYEEDIYEIYIIIKTKMKKKCKTKMKKKK